MVLTIGRKRDDNKLMRYTCSWCGLKFKAWVGSVGKEKIVSTQVLSP